MADRQIQKNQAGEFTIPADTNKERQVTIIIPPGLEKRNFTVWKKDIPLTIASTWKDSQNKEYNIDWINNFGLKSGDNYVGRLPAGDPPYQVRLTKETGKKLFYYDNGVQEFTDVRDVPGRNEVIVSLQIGDPPVGWGL